MDMAIVFAPIRASSRATGPDLSVRIRRSGSAVALELTLSANVQERVRYIDGDRVVASYDEDNHSWTLERISPDRVGEGYKVSVRTIANGTKSVASLRVGCREPKQAELILGARVGADYEFLEITGNTVTFVEK
jgi:hypothetical protein